MLTSATPMISEVNEVVGVTLVSECRKVTLRPGEGEIDV
jgi:hypothetical protein